MKGKIFSSKITERVRPWNNKYAVLEDDSTKRNKIVFQVNQEELNKTNQALNVSTKKICSYFLVW